MLGKYNQNNIVQFETINGFISMKKYCDESYRFYPTLTECVLNAVHNENLLFYSAVGVCEAENTWYNRFIDGSRRTKSITLGRKLEWDEIKNDIFQYFSMIENKKEYKEAIKLGYEVFARKKFTLKAIELGHSEIFAKVAYRRRLNDRELYDKMIALNKEGVSKDLIAYLMLADL